MTKLTFSTGMKLLVAKNYEAAYAQSVAALRQNEKDPLAFFLLGVLAFDTGSTGKSLEFFAKASEHGPDNVRYQTYHAKALLTLGHSEQAKVRADIAAAIGTNDALVADMIGVVYSRTGYHELAIPFFETAVKNNPQWAKFHFNLGASAEFIGDFEKAKAAYKNVLSLDPKFYLAWFSLVSLEKQTAENNSLDTLKALFEGAPRDAEARLLLGHAAAKTLEDLGRFEESYDWLVAAKAAKKAQIQYDKQDAKRIFQAAKTTANRSANRRYENQAASVTVPIFIVGLPRTGTTLIDRVLSSHPQVRSAGELNVFPDLINNAAGLPINAAVNSGVFRTADKVDLLRLGDAYSDKTKDLAQGAAYLIDKLPFNFFNAGLILRALPNAKIIALRRGAQDSCLSNYRQVFAAHSNNHDYAFDLEDTAAYYREFDGLMAHWRENLPPGRFTELAYEDMVFDQENQTRKLLTFCELPWDEACMHFHENATPIATASSVQVRRPLYSGAVGRWKKYGHKLDGLRKALGALAD